jgi:hypothetical protein
MFSQKTSREAIPTIEGKWKEYYENLVLAINGTGEKNIGLAVTPESVLANMKVIEAVITSSKTGKVIDFNTDKSDEKAN